MNVHSCTDDSHWWARTPPRPYDPPGHVADDVRCQCGRFRYDQCKDLLHATPSIKVGTFVPDAAEVYDGIDDDVLVGMWEACADDLRRWSRAFGSADEMTVAVLNQLAHDLEQKAIAVKNGAVVVRPDERMRR